MHQYNRNKSFTLNNKCYKIVQVCNQSRGMWLIRVVQSSLQFVYLCVVYVCVVVLHATIIAHQIVFQKKSGFSIKKCHLMALSTLYNTHTEMAAQITGFKYNKAYFPIYKSFSIFFNEHNLFIDCSDIPPSQHTQQYKQYFFCCLNCARTEI